MIFKKCLEEKNTETILTFKIVQVGKSGVGRLKKREKRRKRKRPKKGKRRRKEKKKQKQRRKMMKVRKKHYTREPFVYF